MCYQKHILIYFLLAVAFLLNPSVSMGHVFDKDTVDLFGVGDTDTFTITDTTGCEALTRATVTDPSIALVAPESTGAVVTQTYTVLATGIGTTTITVNWIGIDFGTEGGECTEEGSHVINVIVHELIEETTPTPIASPTPISEATPTPTPTVALSNFLVQDDSRAIPINFPSTDGDPIALHNGEFVMEVIDLQIPGRGFDWTFTRSYRSRITFDGPLSHNWDFNYNSRLIEITEDNQDAIPTDTFTPVRSGSFTKLGSVVVMDGHGRSDLYGLQSDGTYSTPLGAYTRLTKNEDGSFTLRDRAGNEKFYDKNGFHVKLEDRHGNTMTFTRDEEGKLTKVIDTLGRKITYNYNSNGRLTEVKDFTNRSIKFEYDSNGDLVSVTSPSVTGTPNGNDFQDGKTTKYTYSSGFDDEKLNHNLLTITAPNEVATGGSPRIINVYETDADSYAYGRVITQTYGGTNASGIEAGGDIVYDYEELTSNSTSTNEPVNRVTVTDRNGNKTVYEHNKLGNAVSIKEYTKGLRDDEPEFFETSFEYNVDGEKVKSTLSEGNSVKNTYASEDTESIDYNKSRFKHGNLLENKQIPDSDRGGDQQQLIRTNTYEPIYNRVRTETDPRGNDASYEPPNGGTRSAERYTTTYYFDYQEGSNLGALAKIMGISSEEVQEILDEAGIKLGLGDLNGDGITDDVSGDVVKIVYPTVTLLSDSNQAKQEGDTSQEIVELYAYNKYGQITSKTDAEGNVTTYDYYPENDPDGDGKDEIGGKGNGHFGYLKEVVVDTASSSERDSGTNPKPVKIKTKYFYDPMGNIVKEINRRGIATEYVVNELNQRVKITRAASVPESKGKKKKTTLKAFKYVTNIEYDYNNNVVRKEVENRDSNNGDLAGEFVEYTYEYDILDHLVKEMQEVSQQETLTTEYRYDANENRIKVIQPEGNYQETTYDERDRVFRATNVCGCSRGSPNTTYNYDRNGNVIEVIDGEDNNGDGKNDSALYEYDGYNRLIKTTDPVGNVTERVFDPASNVTKISRWGAIGGSSPTDNSSSGNVLLSQTEYSFDELNRQYQKDKILFVSSGVSTVRSPVLKDGPLGTANDGYVTTRYEYDRKGRMTFMVEDDGDVFEYRYDGVDRRIAQIDPEGSRAEYTYDENNNVTKIVETEITQKGNSPLLTEKFTTINVYDALDRLVRTTDNIGQTRRSSYDSRDNLIFTSDAQGKKVKDEEGLFKGKINEDGNTVYYFYDGIKRRIKEEKDLRKGGQGYGKSDTSNPYNSDGKITITYEYDKNFRLISITDDNGNTIRYEYNDANRKTQETNADGTTKKFEYDQDNNLVKMTDENGTVIDFSYDALNRLTQKDITRASGIIGTTQQKFEYDGLSRVTKSLDNNDPDDDTDDATVTYAYDSLSRLVEEIQNGQAVSSQWDGDNNRLTLIYPNGRKIETTYDKLDRIDRVKDAGATSNIADYDYIGPGRVLERTYSNGIRLSYLDDSRTKDIGYDKVRRPIKLRHLTEDNKLIAGFEHGYDRVNNKLFETRLHEFKGKKNIGDVYAYDSVYRLTKFRKDVVDPKKASSTELHSKMPDTPPLMGGAGRGEVKSDENQTTHTFDGVGNWVNLTIGSESFENMINEMNEYESFKGQTQSHDDNGNLIDDGTNSYEYDFANRLRKITRKTDDTIIAVYNYDVHNRRNKRIVTNTENFNELVQYIYDGWREIEEMDNAGILIQQYVYGIYIDEPLVLDRNLDGNDSAIGEDDQRLFYHQNTLYSVFALTDTTATIVEGYKYDAYGQQAVIEPGLNGVVEFGGDDEITIEGMSAINNPYMFTGRRFDPETGLYYYRTRFLNREQGRFIQRDFIGIWMDLVNLGNGYTYVGSNPANRLDPYGTDSQTRGRQVTDISEDEFSRERDRMLREVEVDQNTGRSYNDVAGRFNSRYFTGDNVQSLYRFRGLVMIGGEVNYYFQGLLAKRYGLSRSELIEVIYAYKIGQIVSSYGQAYDLPTGYELYMAMLGYEETPAPAPATRHPPSRAVVADLPSGGTIIFMTGDVDRSPAAVHRPAEETPHPHPVLIELGRVMVDVYKYWMGTEERGEED